MDLNGAVAVVTGGASGLGAATARALAAEGAKVAILDVNDDLGGAIAGELGGIFAHCDVTSEDDVMAGVDAAARLGEIRVVVNCAGIGPPCRTLARDGTPHSLALFRKVIDINLVGTFNTIRVAASAMMGNEPDENNDRGAIINTASVAAYDGQIGQAAYSASKGGIVGMTLPIARDLSVLGIRVSTIAPGIIDTPLLAGLPEPAKESLGRQVLHPKRLGRPDEYAELVMFLVTHEYMNGESIRMDGGIRMGPK
ncbi:MAG: SDR family oxidoreductase [Acidimicrobiia bacterium]|nr:SDR family oxidoreductase [Acidimicrobiia bacterium]